MVSQGNNSVHYNVYEKVEEQKDKMKRLIQEFDKRWDEMSG